MPPLGRKIAGRVRGGPDPMVIAILVVATSHLPSNGQKLHASYPNSKLSSTCQLNRLRGGSGSVEDALRSARAAAASSLANGNSDHQPMEATYSGNPAYYSGTRLGNAPRNFDQSGGGYSEAQAQNPSFASMFAAQAFGSQNYQMLGGYQERSRNAFNERSSQERMATGHSFSSERSWKDRDGKSQSGGDMMRGRGRYGGNGGRVTRRNRSLDDRRNGGRDSGGKWNHGGSFRDKSAAEGRNADSMDWKTGTRYGSSYQRSSHRDYDGADDRRTGGRYHRERGRFDRYERGNYNRESDRGRGRRPEFDDFLGSFNDADFTQNSLPQIVRNLYHEAPRVAQMTEQEKDMLLNENRIVVRTPRGFSGEIPNPIPDFESTGLPFDIAERCQKKGFKAPTPIQMQSWPVAMSGKDLLGLAQTGSGKTLAYALPSIVHLRGQPQYPENYPKGPTVLVLAPTRELAQQIEKEYKDFGAKAPSSRFLSRGTPTVAAVFGGAPRYYQSRELRLGTEILVACPGRLLDFIQNKEVGLARVTYLVLDEADRMLDMGFEPQILKILGQVRPDRQVLFFSATWPKEVQSLARKILRDPVTIQIGDTSLKASLDVKQTVHFIDEYDKPHHILRILQGLQMGVRVLVFVETKRTAEDVLQNFVAAGISAATLHGDKSQRERNLALKNFRSNRISVLIASDVAARGLDVKGIKIVINYDMPKDIATYVHRIGRTGRAGESGLAISFITPEYRLTGDLSRIFEESGQPIPPGLQRYFRGGFPYTDITPELEMEWKQIKGDEIPSGDVYSNSRRGDWGRGSQYSRGYGYDAPGGRSHTSSNYGRWHGS